MKKNKMMRIASFLLVAVLMSTCAISGTFAKYVTSGTATDTARVAKWGMTIDLNSDNDSNNKGLFKVAYGGTDGDTVVSGTTPDQDNVVAPGTSASDEFKVKGKPETAYVVSFSHASPEGVTERDIFLKTTENGVETTYYPLEWSVTLADYNQNDNGFAGTIAGTITRLGTTTYATLQEALAALEGTTVTYAANKECDIAVTIAWEWDFDTQNSGSITVPNHTINDTYDTLLGDYAVQAPANKTADTDYCLTVAYDLTITVTQID